MCTHPECVNPLFFCKTKSEGFYFQRNVCGQIFLAPREKVGMELYSQKYSFVECNDCRNHLVPTFKYDNGYIFMCTNCCREYRLYLVELVHVQGFACC